MTLKDVSNEHSSELCDGIQYPSSIIILPAAEPDAVLGVPTLLVVVHALRKLVLKQTRVPNSGCLSVFLHLNLTSFTEYSIFWCRITFSLCSVDLQRATWLRLQAKKV